MSEHLVAIVSFEGALKREVKRVRELLKRDETLSHFEFTIEIEGRAHDGEIKLTYGLGCYSAEVKGATIQAVVDEFMRRRGWEQLNAPIAIGYEKIPSDNTDEIPF